MPRVNVVILGSLFATTDLHRRRCCRAEAILIRPALQTDRSPWTRMRQALWPSSTGEHAGEIELPVFQEDVVGDGSNRHTVASAGKMPMMKPGARCRWWY